MSDDDDEARRQKLVQEQVDGARLARHLVYDVSPPERVRDVDFPITAFGGTLFRARSSVVLVMRPALTCKAFRFKRLVVESASGPFDALMVTSFVVGIREEFVKETIGIGVPLVMLHRNSSLEISTLNHTQEGKITVANLGATDVTLEIRVEGIGMGYV